MYSSTTLPNRADQTDMWDVREMTDMPEVADIRRGLDRMVILVDEIGKRKKSERSNLFVQRALREVGACESKA